MTQDIFIGLITTLISAIIAVTWNNYIVPFFIEQFGERIKIYPMWVSDLNFGSGNTHKLKLEIKKLGYNITGHLEFVAGIHSGKKYDLHGRFQSDILTFHYYPQDKYSTSQGSATFKRLNDGELLEGSFAYYSQNQNKIDTVKCSFTPTKR